MKFNLNNLKRRRNNLLFTRILRNLQARKVKEERKRKRLLRHLKKLKKSTISSTALASKRHLSTRQLGENTLKTILSKFWSTSRRTSQIELMPSRTAPRNLPFSLWTTSINSHSTHQRAAMEAQSSQCPTTRMRVTPQPSLSSEMDSERSRFDFHSFFIFITGVEFIFSVVGIIWPKKELITT